MSPVTIRDRGLLSHDQQKYLNHNQGSAFLTRSSLHNVLDFHSGPQNWSSVCILQLCTYHIYTYSQIIAMLPLHWL
jgi:hypothetical protein